MEFAANYEIRSECSVVTDDRILRLKHPRGLYRVRIKNIPRPVYTQPFLLSLHLYFDAPSIEEAQDVAEELLGDCLNILAFTTGSAFRLHRIRQIVDAAPPNRGAMTTVLMWADSIEYEDPKPLLQDELIQSAERLLEFEAPPAIRRAMRWYRLGINARAPDDQFMFFWFALEIIAEFRKPSEKVPDRCSRCHAPLYCETCKNHPVHRPYAKQAISALMKSVDPECDDTVVARLDCARNSLMHGSTLREIEDTLPQPHEEIVDVLGRLVWRALIHQFPRETFDGKLAVCYPSTYVHRRLSGIGNISTIVPVDSEGDLDLSFAGITMAAPPFGPPQSAKPTVISMTVEQHKRLREISFADGDHQEMCRRISGRTRTVEGQVHSLVLATDMATIHNALSRGDTGKWQDLFREIINGADGRRDAPTPSKAT